MKSLIALLTLAVTLKSGECTISAWEKPVISTADGTGTLVEKINDGATNETGITITATSNDTVSDYNMTQTPATPVLAIDSNGVVTVSTGTVSYSSVTAFTLTVVATDANGTATATVTVSVNAVPVITSHDVSVCIADGSTADVCLIELAATDSNSGTNFTWAIQDGNTNTDFTITSAGSVQVATGKTLSIATTANYTLEMTAADNSTPTALTATTTVTASVLTTCTSACSSATAIVVSSLIILAALIVTKFY